jgi:hypothetical protein
MGPRGVCACSFPVSGIVRRAQPSAWRRNSDRLQVEGPYRRSAPGVARLKSTLSAFSGISLAGTVRVQRERRKMTVAFWPRRRAELDLELAVAELVVRYDVGWINDKEILLVENDRLTPDYCGLRG